VFAAFILYRFALKYANGKKQRCKTPIMSDQPRRPRGRPRSFEPRLALQQARDAFWRAGYAGTSLDELAAAMAMNRPSIYATFGDKESLYLQAIQRYAQQSRDTLDATLAGPGTLRERLCLLYQGATTFYLQGGPEAPRGCFLVGTALTEALPSATVRDVLERTFVAFTRSFRHAFQRAAESGELSAATSLEGLAQLATSTLNTLSLRARTGASPTLLKQLAAAAVDVICGQTTAAHPLPVRRPAKRPAARTKRA
jgi:AcrR family transcriptional regulator